MAGSLIIYDLLSFYEMQFGDYWTTTLGVKLGAMEGNPIARQIVESPFKLALYKFGLASLIPILILIFHIAPESMIYYDTVIEVLITWWNTLTIWRHKVGK